MEIYKVHYQDRKYKDHEKLFIKLEKAKRYSDETVEKEINLIYKDRCDRVFTREEYEKKLEAMNKCSEHIEILDFKYPTIKYRIKVFEDDIQSTKINYFYIQDEDGEIEKYEQELDITITKIYVED